MCYQEKKQELKEKWENSNFVQNQLWSIVTIIFFGGGAWVSLGNVQEEVKTIKCNQERAIEITHALDKQTDLNTDDIEDNAAAIEELKGWHKYKPTAKQ